MHSQYRDIEHVQGILDSSFEVEAIRTRVEDENTVMRVVVTGQPTQRGFVPWHYRSLSLSLHAQ